MTTAEQSKSHSIISDIIFLMVVMLLAVGALKGIGAIANYLNHENITQYEAGIVSGSVQDESTVIEATAYSADGNRSVYFKLGHGDYANTLRAKGIGCRFYLGGSPYTFNRYKTTDPIPLDTISTGSLVVGECIPNTLMDNFDLAQAQK
jgi:hypothetical protein